MNVRWRWGAIATRRADRMKGSKRGSTAAIAAGHLFWDAPGNVDRLRLTSRAATTFQLNDDDPIAAFSSRPSVRAPKLVTPTPAKKWWPLFTAAQSAAAARGFSAD